MAAVNTGRYGNNIANNTVVTMDMMVAIEIRKITDLFTPVQVT